MPALERNSILTTARDVAADVLRAESARVDAEAVWPERSLRALLAAGLGGLVVPATAGGLGQGLLALAEVCEILGQECPSTALCFGMHCVGSAVLAAKATPVQRDRYLGPISRGEHLTTLALSEPGSGAHIYYPQTRIEAMPGGYRLHGVKSFVTNGGRADSYVLSTMAAAPDAPPAQFSCVIVPRDTRGIHWGEPWRGVGMRGNSSIQMTLQGAEISGDDLLGEEGDQLWYMFQVIAPYFLMAMSGTYLGAAEAAVQEAVRHLRRRRYAHSGVSLGEQPVLQHRLGALWSAVERTRRLLYYAAREGDAGVGDALPAVLAAKAEVADAAVWVVNEAMTLCGGIVYQNGSRLERLLRDVRAAHVMAPTTDVLRTWVGRALLGYPLLAE